MSEEICSVITDSGSSFPIKPQIDNLLKHDKISVESDSLNDSYCVNHESKDSKVPNGKIRHKHENGLVRHAKSVADSPHHCPCSGIHDVDEVDVSSHTFQDNESSMCKSFNQLELKKSEQEEPENDMIDGIHYIVYESELQMPDIMRLITKDLSEPYSIYTYRYFIHNWPKLCFLAVDEGKCVGAIVCKLDMHKKMVRRGYIAMLAVDSDYRRRKIGSHLVRKAIKAMIADDCDEVVLETEITNKAALNLYENLGFVRDKRLFRYYLNGVDALRLKLWLR